MRINTKLLELRGGDFSQRDDLLTREQFEERVHYGATMKLFRFVRRTIAQ